MRYRRWTDEEIERLKAMIAARASANRIAVALRRPIASIYDGAERLGLHLPTRTDERRRARNLLNSSTSSE